MNRRPTARERRQERTSIALIFADCAVVALLFGVALLTNSLSVFAGVVPAVFLLAVQTYAAWVMLATNRGKLGTFEFGAGKVEQAIWAVLGVGLLVGGFWVTERIVGVVLGGHEAVRPIGLALAAFANAVALLVGFFGYSAAKRVMSRGGSSEFRSCVSVRGTTLFGMAVVQVALTVAVLARDPEIALASDALGGAFVAILSLRLGAGALRMALPDLFDAPAPQTALREIHAAAEAVLPQGELVGLRTRRCGRAIEAEIRVAGNACRSTADLAQWQGEIAGHQTAKEAELKIALVLAPAGSTVTGSSVGHPALINEQPASNA